MYFADFWANFLRFFDNCFFCLKWVLKRQLWLVHFIDNNWLQFCGYEAFFCWEIWQKMAKIETIFLIFFAVLRFFPFFRRVSMPIMTCLLFCEHLDALLAEVIFPLDFCAFVIKKFITSSFLVQVVCKSLFFFMIWLQVFLKNFHKWFQ